MTNLPKYTVEFDERREKWELQQNSTGKVIKRTDTKAEMTAGGVMKKAVGKEGGSVMVQKASGGYQEERTYPRKRDPRSSPG
jgi:hypothetical protein